MSADTKEKFEEDLELLLGLDCPEYSGTAESQLELRLEGHDYEIQAKYDTTTMRYNIHLSDRREGLEKHHAFTPYHTELYNAIRDHKRHSSCIADLLMRMKS